ncbi:MAG TPA: hypothetical protein VLA09_01215 [Longimicrobiales bacterium]|nr:hypothetical protein [Longimicrobiales bacterium]
MKRFSALGLPGAEMLDRGLRDAAAEVESVEALLIAIAEPRLRREGVPVPRMELPDPEMRCYRLLEAEHGELAHARYNALRHEVTSFADACHLVRARGTEHAS